MFSKLETLTVKLNIGVLEMESTWKPSEEEKNAAWELYVELVTRISFVELKPNEGLLREALSSLYTLFSTTREVLKRYGPKVVRGSDDADMSVGLIAIAMINIVVRPLLAKWHPLLLDYEGKKPQEITALEHEKDWEKNAELREQLNQTRQTLIQYTKVLAKIAKVPFFTLDSAKLPVSIQKPTQLGEKFFIEALQ